MPVIKENVRLLRSLFSQEEIGEIVRMAQQISNEENLWRAKLQDLYKDLEGQVMDSLLKYGKVKPELMKEFDTFFLKHMLSVQGLTIRETKNDSIAKLAGPPKGRMPRTLEELRKLWDTYRKKGELPPRVRDISKKVKKAYISKCQSVWDKASEGFKEGSTGSQEAAVEAVKAAGKTTYSRSKTIVATETTYYYNKVRRDTYDRSTDVTHYLYMAIRDHRTTKWCKDRNRLVYQKDDPIFEKETPPVHWNCRSEILPLSPLNPRHKALIDDPAKLRRNHKCEPLPAGWNRK